jgi:hypothetical protein
MFKRIVTLLCGTLLLGILPAAADEWNKKTTVTFSKPVELPGVVLPAGKYVFKLVELGAERHIVRVTDVEGTKIFATVLAIPNWRLTPTEKTSLSFAERAGNNPEALRAWFYPGDNFGHEFVYPKKRAVELASTNHQLVLTGPVLPAEEPAQLAKAPVIAVTPENKEVEIAQEVQAAPFPVVAQAIPAPAVAEAHPAVPATLPATAGLLPLMFLVGLTSLGAAAFLRMISKQIE